MADGYSHGAPGSQRRAGRLPEAPLTTGEIRDLLRECVTVVKPGETLIIRVLSSWTPAQVQEYQQAVTQALESWGSPFSAVVVPAEGLGVIQAPSLPERVRSLATRDRTRG